jgi:hypothetical protein
LEEDDVVIKRGAGPPAEPFVEPPSAAEVMGAEGDQVDPLLHQAILSRSGFNPT